MGGGGRIRSLYLDAETVMEQMIQVFFGGRYLVVNTIIRAVHLFAENFERSRVQNDQKLVAENPNVIHTYEFTCTEIEHGDDCNIQASLF